MKILHIIPSYLPARFASGPIIPTHSLNKELSKNGVEVVVYTTNLDGDRILDAPLNQEINLDGVKVFYFPITCRFWQYSWELHRALACNFKNFDLIHITSVFLSASTLGAYYAKKSGKPYIISPHGSLMKEPLGRGYLKKNIYLSLLEKRNLENAAAVHFLNDKEESDYLTAGLSLKKEIIVPNGIDADKFQNVSRRISFRKKFSIPSECKIILFLGRLHPIKGLDTLISAFAEVIKKEPDSFLVLAGPDENDYGENLKSQISKFNIGGKVVFTGMIVGEEKNAALRESDVFVLPSYTEAMSVAVLEAMYFGLPAIATKNVGNASDILRVDAGIVVEKTESAVAEAILKVLRDPALAKKMGENGRRLVAQEFSGEKMAKRWIEEYEKIIKEWSKQNF